jgi:hypothetical protein
MHTSFKVLTDAIGIENLLSFQDAIVSDRSNMYFFLMILNAT